MLSGSVREYFLRFVTDHKGSCLVFQVRDIIKVHITTVILCIYCARYPDKMARFQTKFLIFIFKTKYMLWALKSNVSMVPMK